MAADYTTCARQQRLELEAHERARHECLESAKELDLHMSCDDEGECPSPTHCEFFKRAIAEVTAEDEMMP